jgi:hypothetical protein
MAAGIISRKIFNYEVYYYRYPVIRSRTYEKVPELHNPGANHYPYLKKLKGKGDKGIKKRRDDEIRIIYLR